MSQGRPYSLNKNYSLDLILAMVIFYMINQKMKVFKINLEKLNLEHALL